MQITLIFFSTHPSDDKRIQAMKEIIDKIENEDSNTQYLENSSICSNCGSTVIEGDLFCRNCGVKIEKENKKTKICLNCGTLNNADNKFCINCGFDFYNERKCSNCGFLVDEDSIYCENCGNKLK